MTTMGAYEVKTHLSKILDDVQRGEVVVITRKGKPVAILTVYPAERLDLVEQIRTFRRRHAIAGRGITLAEIEEFKTEGRK